MARKPTLETVTASMARWQTRLRRAVRAIEKLEKQKKRIEKSVAKPKAEPLAVTIMREIAAPDPTPGVICRAVPDTGIPAFLQRKKLDPVAEQIKAEQVETKKKKAAGRIAKMKAKQSGETKKMPLTGKAALEAIRNG
jgi:hypothetical protein